MAEDNIEVSGDGEECPPTKCPPCPLGLPAWMATFSDLVTLLLTFFVLLLSFAKTESAKYEAAMGSIREAFGGNVLKYGEVIQRGKSPDDAPTMIESEQPVKPFPISLMTTEGFLDKQEINRASDEELQSMRTELNRYGLALDTQIYEETEGVKVKINEKILFKKGSLETTKIPAEVYTKMIKLLSNSDWTIYVIGHSSVGETSIDGGKDAFSLSAERAMTVTRNLIKSGLLSSRINSIFYGDSKPVKIQSSDQSEIDRQSRRVEFFIRKRNLDDEGHKVPSQ